MKNTSSAGFVAKVTDPNLAGRAQNGHKFVARVFKFQQLTAIGFNTIDPDHPL